tara:strand:+ start:341 stop:511 length:171 start_codon:yes stop_codon:yes gene_type:complete
MVAAMAIEILERSYRQSLYEYPPPLFNIFQRLLKISYSVFKVPLGGVPEGTKPHEH